MPLAPHAPCPLMCTPVPLTTWLALLCLSLYKDVASISAHAAVVFDQQVLLAIRGEWHSD